MKVIKNPIAVKILAVIANRMLQTGYIPDVLREARIILIHKGCDDCNLNNWRPITISSVIRRVICKTLDSIVRSIIDLNPNQRGFVMTPGAFININIVDGILRTANLKKSLTCLAFLDISKTLTI